MGTVGRFCVRPWNFAQVKCFFHVCHWRDWPGMNGNYGEVLCLTVELYTGKLLHTVIVMRETDRIWMGTMGRFCVRPWNFAQVKCFFYVCHARDGPDMDGNCGKVLCQTVELCTGKVLHTVIVMRETGRIWMGTVGLFCVRP